MFKELIASILLSGSVSLPVTVPVKDVVDIRNESYQPVDNVQVLGSFNYRTYIDLDSLADTIGGSHSFTLVFDVTSDNSYTYSCSLVKNDSYYQDLYLRSITMSFLEDEYQGFIISVSYNAYDIYLNDFSFSSVLFQGYVDDDLPSNEQVIFNSRNSIYLHAENAYLFDTIFTHEENEYVKNYTGYYSFTSSVNSLPQDITVYGTILFNNTMYLGFTNHEVGSYATTLRFYYYDIYDSVYSAETFTFPFNSQKVSSSLNILFTNTKMFNTTYTNLSNIGVFNYVVEPSYQDSSFESLMFTSIDIPIYFLSRLLSFELFGVNMFVAFTGLLTLVVLLLLIRKFF